MKMPMSLPLKSVSVCLEIIIVIFWSSTEPHVLLFRRQLPTPATAQMPVASQQVAAH